MKVSDERSCLAITSQRQCLNSKASRDIKCQKDGLEELQEDHSLAQKRNS